MTASQQEGTGNSDSENVGPLRWLDDEFAALMETKGLRRLSVRESPHVAGQVQIEGKPYLDFGSNDYLELSARGELLDAVRSCSGHVGWGSGASPLIHGRGTLHRRLEQELAAFEGTESALTFSSGYAANLGVIAAVVGKGDFIFSDARNHASIIDGCRLSGAEILVYRHNDIDHLAQLLDEVSSQAGRRLIVTDALFSMDGDLANLRDLAPLAEQGGAMLMVDEAHGTGVFGIQGRGVSEHLGVKEGVDILVGTLSKSIGCHGGFVAGTRRLTDWIANRARSYVFSTAVPEATCMAAVAALGLVKELGEQRKQLLEKAEWLRQELRMRGWSLGNSSSQIIPVILGENESVLKKQTELMEAGIYVPAIRPPSVPEGESLLRISLTTGHTDVMLGRLIETLGK